MTCSTEQIASYVHASPHDPLGSIPLTRIDELLGVGSCGSQEADHSRNSMRHIWHGRYHPHSTPAGVAAWFLRGLWQYVQQGIANWTGAPQPQLNVALNASTPSGVKMGRGVSYDRMAREQVEYLLNDVPRTDDGAISHRIEQVQLW